MPACPVFFACEPGTNWRELVKGQRFIHFRFDDPDYNTRLHLWKEHLAECGLPASDADLQPLADRFVLTPAQIRDAVTVVLDAQRLSAEQPLPGFDPTLLFAAARAQSDQDLGNLAVKVNAVQSWDDLVLPPPRATALKKSPPRSSTATWSTRTGASHGASRRARGSKVLFAGAVGHRQDHDGRRHRQRSRADLYKIDLSSDRQQVHRRDREEPRSHLSRGAGEQRHPLLRRGRRAVRQALRGQGRPRPLRQHRGRLPAAEDGGARRRGDPASNLSKNIDDAFARRMHYVIDFPLPDESIASSCGAACSRPRRRWRQMSTSRFLAKQFPLAGGDIKNVALDAAFLAAQDGRVITMKQLVQALARQMMKQGGFLRQRISSNIML